MLSIIFAAIVAVQPYEAVVTNMGPLSQQPDITIPPMVLPCMPIQGTRVRITAKADFKGIDIWRQVEVLDGECKGELGWVTAERLTAAAK